MQFELIRKNLVMLLAVVAMLSLGQSADAALVLSGGGLTLVDEGPAGLLAGNAAPINLATAGTAFAIDELGFGHIIPNVNNGTYGNASSWISGPSVGTSGPFIGISLGAAPTTVAGIAFGRSNVIGGDPCGGVCTDRNLGLYTLQFTTDANPTAATPDSSWTTIGTLNNTGASSDPNFKAPHLRHAYNFDAVNATGLRLIVPNPGGLGTAIDEIELYSAPLVEPLRLVEVGPASSSVPANLANNPGATAFAKDVFANGGAASHQIDHLNDGIYGNSNSWIGNSANSFAGIDFGDEFLIDSIAWGRSNVLSGDPCPGGVCTDRTGATYIVQFTTELNPDELTADSLWTTLGSVTYDAIVDSEHLRHLYEFDAVFATGIRIVASSNGIAIDEIEVTQVVPEPASLGLLVMGLAGIGCRRRQRIA